MHDANANPKLVHDFRTSQRVTSLLRCVAAAMMEGHGALVGAVHEVAHVCDTPSRDSS